MNFSWCLNTIAHYIHLETASMNVIGTVESLWRYPVKSMRGEELDEIFAGYPGVYGDRVFAFTSSLSPKGFPFFTGRDQRQMIRYRARFRNPEKAARPINLAEAQSSGANPISANASELMIEVETPDGKTIAIDDPALIDNLRANIDGKHELKLLRSDKAITDCRPFRSLHCNQRKNLARKRERTSISGGSEQTYMSILRAPTPSPKTNSSAKHCASDRKLSSQSWSAIRAA